MNNEIFESIKKNTGLIAIFTLVVGSALAATNALTKDRIAEEVLKAQSKALNEVVPSHLRSNTLLSSPFTLSPATQQALNLDNDSVGWQASNNNQITAVVVPVTATDGYSGDIDLLVGIDRNLNITGVRVVTHTETPGLGDKIELRKSDWILSFNGTSIQIPSSDWAVKKDGGQFDQFTGATITPRGVVNSVYMALQQAEKNQSIWFGEVSNER